MQLISDYLYRDYQWSRSIILIPPTHYKTHYFKASQILFGTASHATIQPTTDGIILWTCYIPLIHFSIILTGSFELPKDMAYLQDIVIMCVSRYTARRFPWQYWITLKWCSPSPPDEKRYILLSGYA